MISISSILTPSCSLRKTLYAHPAKTASHVSAGAQVLAVILDTSLQIAQTRTRLSYLTEQTIPETSSDGTQ